MTKQHLVEEHWAEEIEPCLHELVVSELVQVTPQRELVCHQESLAACLEQLVNRHACNKQRPIKHQPARV